MKTRAYCYSKIDALAEANDQFHWGRNARDLEHAVQILRSHCLNPGLVDQLLFKARRSRAAQASACISDAA